MQLHPEYVVGAIFTQNCAKKGGGGVSHYLENAVAAQGRLWGQESRRQVLIRRTETIVLPWNGTSNNSLQQ